MVSLLNFFHGGKIIDVSFFMYFLRWATWEKRAVPSQCYNFCWPPRLPYLVFCSLWVFLATPYFLFLLVSFYLGFEVLNTLWLEGESVYCEAFRLKVHLIWREQKAWENRCTCSLGFLEITFKPTISSVDVFSLPSIGEGPCWFGHRFCLALSDKWYKKWYALPKNVSKS